MTEELKRYLGNERSKVAHDLSNLDERCNTDAIEDKREMDETEWLYAMQGGDWRPCLICFRPRVYR